MSTRGVNTNKTLCEFSSSSPGTLDDVCYGLIIMVVRSNVGTKACACYLETSRAR